MNHSLFVIVTHDRPGNGQTTPRWLGGTAVATEPADGSTVDRIPFPAVEIQESHDGTYERVLRLTDLSGRLTITDSRLIMVCRRFQRKGGGWRGTGIGALIAVVFNVVSKTRVAISGAGKAAVAHVRYERIGMVGWRPAANVTDQARVRIGLRPVDADTDLLLTITVPRDLDAALVAQEIIRRVARHRLALGQNTAELTELADARRPVAASAGFTEHRIPASQPDNDDLEAQR